MCNSELSSNRGSNILLVNIDTNNCGQKFKLGNKFNLSLRIRNGKVVKRTAAGSR